MGEGRDCRKYGCGARSVAYVQRKAFGCDLDFFCLVDGYHIPILAIMRAFHNGLTLFHFRVFAATG